MRSAPASGKTEKFAGGAPAFTARLQEPECVLSCGPAAGAAPAMSQETDEFNPFLSCGTCFVPMLDLSPDEHGVAVNTFGSTGTQEPQLTTGAPSMIQPVLLKPTAAVPAAPAAAPLEFRQLVDCPTCFVPATDLSYVSACVRACACACACAHWRLTGCGRACVWRRPDEHGTMVNTGATRTNAAVESAVPEPEFLEYIPLDDEDVLGEPCLQSTEEWSALDGQSLGDPFSGLWDRTGPVDTAVYAGFDGASASNLGKRASALRPVRGEAASAMDAYDNWSVDGVDALTDDGQGMKRKKTDAESKAAAHSRNLCPRATRILKEWMTSAEHFDHPYPDEKEKMELAAKAGITPKQLTIWFTNARKRLWVPMRKRQVCEAV